MMMIAVLVMVIMLMKMRSMMNKNFVVIFFSSLGEGSFDDEWNVLYKSLKVPDLQFSSKLLVS